MSYRIIDIPAPASATEEPGWELRAVAALWAAFDIETWGDDDDSTTAQQMVASLAHQEDTKKIRAIAVPADVTEPGADDVVGTVSVWLPLRDNVTKVNIDLTTRADARRQGIGAALWDHAVAHARAHDRSIVQSWTAFGVEPAEDDPQALAAPTGSGRVPGDAPATRFVQARGFTLEQAERRSVLPLPFDEAAIAQMRADAKAAAGDDYELVGWQDAVPEEWIDEYCVLLRGMSTDAPTAGLAWEEEEWTPERVREMEATVADFGNHTLVLAARHKATGELAGYTEIDLDPTKPEIAFQDNTIVRASHRGHRLGMLLKAANLQQLVSMYPAIRRVQTWNAEENGYMLSINVALGFRPAGGGAGWQLTLDG